MKRILACALVLAGLVTACGKSDSNDSAATTCRKDPGGAAYATLQVPAQCSTIQAAVDAAKEGDLVLISPGVYKEAVSVETKNLTVRGLDRNKVIIDGEFQRDNGIKIFSDGVVIENLTARNHKGNGVFFTGSYSKDAAAASSNSVLSGYRASYVTAYNNGDYGIYAFAATKGQFDHSLGSGSPDAGFYIGQCNPCDALMTDNISETNMLGYSGTNSTGVVIVNSIFRKNRLGMVPNSENGEALAPNAATTVIGNLIEDNNSADAPLTEKYKIGYGSGIALGGVNNNIVERNRINNQLVAGVVITDQPEKFVPSNNVVRDNVITKTGVSIAMAIFDGPTTSNGNCFEGNTIDSEFPEGLQEKAKCGAPSFDLGSMAAVATKLAPVPPNADWQKIKAPADQPNMPNAATAPPVKFVGPTMPDLKAIKVPAAS